MKLKTKRKYFFQAPINALIRALTTMAGDVHDDIDQLAPQEYTSLLNASAENRGRIIIVPNAGVDEFHICRKNGSSYEWKQITVT